MLCQKNDTVCVCDRVLGATVRHKSITLLPVVSECFGHSYKTCELATAHSRHRLQKQP